VLRYSIGRVRQDGRHSENGRDCELGLCDSFTADAKHRAYMDGVNLLFVNAAFRGRAHAGGGDGFGAEEAERH
jgi:hypothetical protein